MAPGRILNLRLNFIRPFFSRGPLLPTTRSISTSLTSTPSRARSPPTRLRQSPYPSSSSRSFSTSPPPSPSSSSSNSSPTSLTGRLKHLIKTHGWYALGIYTALGLIDFSISFGLIYLIGAEHVAKMVHEVRSAVGGVFRRPIDSPDPSDPTKGATDTSGSGGSESLYAMAILAYGIHKTLFLPVRIGLTAAITPKFVGFLTQRGWVGQGGARRAAQHVKDKVQRARDGRESP